MGRAFAAVAASDVNRFADQRPGGSRRGLGQRRVIFVGNNLSVHKAKREHFGRSIGDAVLPPLAADAQHAVGGRD